MPSAAKRSHLRTTVAIIPAAVFLVASLSADLVAIVGHDPMGIWTVLPAGPVAGGWVNAELSSTALLLLAIALARAKQAGFWLALAALGGAVVVQGLFHHHPVAATVAILCTTILVLTRRRYIAATGSQELLIGAGLLTAAAIVAVAASLGQGPASSEVARFGRTIGTWLDGGTMSRLRLVSWVTAGLIFARVAAIAAEALLLTPASDRRRQRDLEVARTALRAGGRGGLYPYQHEAPVSPFVAPDGRSVIAFARAGRTAVMLGEPAGPPGEAGPAFEAWVDRCRRLDWLPVVYQASRTFKDVAEPRGWHACRIGAEAIVDPVAFDLGSPRLANVRHTVTRSRRGGIRVQPVMAGGAVSAATLAELVALDAEWRRAAGPSLGFTVGHFAPDRIADAAIAMATDDSGRAVAFVVLRRTGADGGWLLDVMRRRPGGVPGARPDAVPGAVEACLVEAIGWLAHRGVRRLSLGLAPLAGLDQHEGTAFERGLAVASSMIRPIYDVRGLAFFKDKLGPTWEPRYLLVPHAWSYPSAALALLRLHLGGSWTNVIRSLVQPGIASRAAAA